MANTPASAKEVNAMVLSELLYQFVLLQVRRRSILHVVIQSHDNLAAIMDLGGANVHPFLDDWKTVIMGHAAVRRDGDVVAGMDRLAGRKADGVSLDDLLSERLRLSHGWWGGGEDI